MNGLKERRATHRSTGHRCNTPLEMVIDFERMTWTCTEHDEVMRLDSGEECPRCRKDPRGVT